MATANDFLMCDVCGATQTSSDSLCRSCGAAIESTPSEPATFALPAGARLRDGRYLIGKVLGQGGFGITYACHDTQEGRPVAIKEYFPWGCVRRGAEVEPGGDVLPEEFIVGKDKFGDEATMLTQFLTPNNPGVVDVYEVFEENNTSYMVMELLEGRTLAEVLEQRGGLIAPEEVTVYLESVGRALAAVHGLNVLHRDIKPENVMVCPGPTPQTPRVVLMDFGSARVIEANRFGTGSRKRLTTLLTPGYAPLEQYGTEQSFGPYTDIYALGALGYHLLTGQVPAQATDRAAGVELTAPHKILDHIDPNLSGAILWAMQMKINLRPQSVYDFLAVLRSSNDFDASAYFTEESVEQPPLVVAPPRETLPSTVNPDQKGWHVVTIPWALWDNTGKIEWPQRCACCGGTNLLEIYSSHSFPYNQLPYCLACKQHTMYHSTQSVSDTLSAPVNGALSHLAAAVCTFSAFLLTGSMLSGAVPGMWAAASFVGFWGGLGFVIKQTRRTVSPKQEKRARDNGTLSSTCSALGAAMEYRGAMYGGMIFAFRNRNFARDFRNANVQQAYANARRRAEQSAQHLQSPFPAVAAPAITTGADLLSGKMPPPPLPEYPPMASNKRAWPHQRPKVRVKP
jgi:serine/threonine protein kinase